MNKKEGKLQAQIFSYIWNKYPDMRGCLFSTFQETSSQIDGAIKRSLGLVAGVSDFIFCDNGDTVGIELKYPDSSHKVDHIIQQAQWLLKVPKRGYFCDSLEMAEDIIINKGKGIDPKRVLEYAKSLKTKTMIWQKFQ